MHSSMPSKSDPSFRGERILKMAKKKENPGVCGSRKKDKNFCDEPAKPDDKMKEFSCDK